ncbi:MAG: methyltransferase domain-containing protein [Acidobacteria bacterium]|nr:methyltransferase domain-containing protein [Acidobacteriota bacterium]NIM63616.1 methyltransferase domain-containing protein [Acidobacteriota bacterium]NIO59186.1 methyltransferase domain-containing protein [Acidobacteriota bacterium]NIQ30213.1 methyltransferase domain-containing protein [Acidobacteriota bacterium]NIQ85141.1 methyltransferase domain-containing protein [Acidobacteriota bacterium]
MSEDRSQVAQRIDVDTEVLREAIKDEYKEVAEDPNKGFHFHTGRTLTEIVGYEEAWLEGVAESAIESFAGTGNPFSMGELAPGEKVVDIGSGGGIDSLIAARMVGPEGEVVGIDMTPEMLEKARAAAEESGITNVEFREAFMEELPVPDEWADVIISNGVLNLTPDKPKTLAEWKRVLRPGGRLQIGDILVARPVSNEAKQKIDLWTG